MIISLSGNLFLIHCFKLTILFKALLTKLFVIICKMVVPAVFLSNGLRYSYMTSIDAPEKSHLDILLA